MSLILYGPIGHRSPQKRERERERETEERTCVNMPCELKKTYVRSKPYEMNPPVQSTGVCLANPPHIVAFQALDYRIVPEIRATEKNVN